MSKRKNKHEEDSKEATPLPPENAAEVGKDEEAPTANTPPTDEQLRTNLRRGAAIQAARAGVLKHLPGGVSYRAPGTVNESSLLLLGCKKSGKIIVINPWHLVSAELRTTGTPMLTLQMVTGDPLVFNDEETIKKVMNYLESFAVSLLS